MHCKVCPSSHANNPRPSNSGSSSFVTPGMPYAQPSNTRSTNGPVFGKLSTSQANSRARPVSYTHLTLPTKRIV